MSLVQTILMHAEEKWQLGTKSGRVNDSEAGGLTNVGWVIFKQLFGRLAAEMLGKVMHLLKRKIKYTL